MKNAKAVSILFTVILFVLTFDKPSSAQGCPGDMILSSQAQVDAFTCTEVIGNLRISGPDIISLDQLTSLKYISGNLLIEDNLSLESLEGLSSLDSVGGALQIKSNNVLSNIDALNSLKTVRDIHISSNHMLSDIELSALKIIYHDTEDYNGGIFIDGNENLNGISGFNNLISTGQITISNNPKLEGISGFNALESTSRDLTGFPGSISIIANESLTNLQVFPSLTEVGNISISSNKRLSAIDGFSSVSVLYGTLSINLNESLTSINGFQKLTEMSSISRAVSDVGLIIDDNSSLESFTGLSSLEVIGLQYNSRVSISNNPSLKNLDGLSSLTTILGDIGTASLLIRNNATLENIDGLSALTVMAGLSTPVTIQVTQNPLLTECCALRPLFEFLDEIFGLETLITNGNIQISENGGCTAEDIIACGQQKITKFDVVDLRTGNVVGSFNNDSVTIDIADPNFSYWAIQANTFPAQVGSVIFSFDHKNKIIDNGLPYISTLAPSRHLKLTTYTLTADVYSESNGNGIKGNGRTATITIINSASVVSFDVVDKYGNFLMSLNEGAKIDPEDPKFKSFSIRANTNPTIVGGVKFWLNNHSLRVEQTAPYAMNGDSKGVYNPWKAIPGDYALRAVPYIMLGEKKYEGETLEVHFKVTSESLISVVNFDIVDTSGKFLKRLSEGDIIEINDHLGNGTAIVANTTGPVGSVQFDLNNHFYRVENAAPYSLAGDNNGTHFNPWLPQAGHYTLKATPYSKPNLPREAGNSLTLHFTVVKNKSDAAYRTATTGSEAESLESEEASGLTIYPVPVEVELFVNVDDEVGNDAVLSILTIHGLSVYNGIYSGSTSINTLDLKPGVYFVQVVSNNGFRRMARFIKK